MLINTIFSFELSLLIFNFISSILITLLLYTITLFPSYIYNSIYIETIERRTRRSEIVYDLKNSNIIRKLPNPKMELFFISNLGLNEFQLYLTKLYASENLWFLYDIIKFKRSLVIEGYLNKINGFHINLPDNINLPLNIQNKYNILNINNPYNRCRYLLKYYIISEKSQYNEIINKSPILREDILINVPMNTGELNLPYDMKQEIVQYFMLDKYKLQSEINIKEYSNRFDKVYKELALLLRDSFLRFRKTRECVKYFYEYYNVSNIKKNINKYFYIENFDNETTIDEENDSDNDLGNTVELFSFGIQSAPDDISIIQPCE